ALGIADIEKFRYLHQNLGELFWHLDQVGWAAVGITVGTIVAIEGSGRLLPKAAAPLFGIAATTFIASAFELDVLTVEAVYGAIPETLPNVAVPAFTGERLLSLLPMALLLAGLCALETLLSATAADQVAGTRHDSDKELIGCGLANITASMVGGIPVCGVIVRSRLNARTGAKTRIAALCNALALLAVMLFLAPIVGQIPLPALAGLLIIIAVRMVNVRAYARMLADHHWTDFAMLMATMLLTAFVGLSWGITTGLAFALVAYLTRVRGKSDPSQAAAAQSGDPGEGVGVVEIEGPLFFHTARKHTDHVRDMGPEKTLVVSLAKTDAIDASGLEALRAAIKVHQPNRTVYLAGVSTEQRALLDRTGVADLLGDANIFATEDEALGAAGAA
ncbi:MAG: SulP family sulfate permease, partial [Myxococcota bacterium]